MDQRSSRERNMKDLQGHAVLMAERQKEDVGSGKDGWRDGGEVGVGEWQRDGRMEG